MFTQEICKALEPYVIKLAEVLKKKGKLDYVYSQNPHLDDEQHEGIWLFIVYIKGMIQQKKVKRLFEQINETVKNEKKVKNFIYNMLKLDYKTANNIWSWYEYEELGICNELDWDEVKFSTYELH